MAKLPPNPRNLESVDLQPAASRELPLFGATVELVLLPERADRPSRPSLQRPAFQSSPADRILATETIWRNDGFAVTPNRYPFARQQFLLWSEQPTREHSEAFLTLLFGWALSADCRALVNSIGAAASIPRAHAHLTSESADFLSNVAEQQLHAPWLPDIDGVRYYQKDIPCCVLGVRGEPSSRAAAIHAMQLFRLTAACNLVVEGDTTWVYPRSEHEVPTPHFPFALGAAELWGRWCFIDEESFANATSDDLAQALKMAGCPRLES